MADTLTGPRERVAVRDGLLLGPLDRLDQIRLAGTRCLNCKETALGANRVCLNCGRDEVESIPLSRDGVLWTFTIVRHKPPGDYRGPEPFQPFGLGLVELPDGLRVMSPLAADVSTLKIGAKLSFKPIVQTAADGRETVAFAFEPAA